MTMLFMNQKSKFLGNSRQTNREMENILKKGGAKNLLLLSIGPAPMSVPSSVST